MLMDAFPAEWQDEFKFRQRAAAERKHRARQFAAVRTAKYGHMVLSPKGHECTAFVTLESEKIATHDKGKTWVFVNSGKARLTDSEAIRILRERFNEKWLQYLDSKRGKLVRKASIASHWGDTGTRVLSWV